MVEICQLLADVPLYLGTCRASAFRERLKQHQISHILSVAHECRPLFPQDFNYMVVKARDIYDQDLISYFDRTYEFIEDGIKNGGVLIHCIAGVSRSVTVAVAYFMKKYNMSAYEALDSIQRVWERAHPNEGFFEQLQFYENLKCTTMPSSTYPNSQQAETWNYLYLQVLAKFGTKAEVEILELDQITEPTVPALYHKL